MEITNKNYDVWFFGIDEYSVDGLLDVNHGAEAVAWCDGFIFGLSHVDSAKFAEYLLEKNLRVYAGLDYAKMPKYQDQIKTKYNRVVGVIDHSNTLFWNKVAKFLKKEVS